MLGKHTGTKLVEFAKRRKDFVRKHPNECDRLYGMIQTAWHNGSFQKEWKPFIEKARKEIGYSRFTYDRDISFQLWKTYRQVFGTK